MRNIFAMLHAEFQIVGVDVTKLIIVADFERAAIITLN